MGGKTSTSTSTVSIPPEVLARYNAVNARAEAAASAPFQKFGNTAADFVAQINAQQRAGIDDINTKSGSYQPYMDAATSATTSGMGPAYAGIDNYMSPYIRNVADTTGAMMRQSNEQAQSGALGTAISSGAFGGDRAGVAAANLDQQNQMTYGKTMADIYNQGYTQALGASQADLARQMAGGAQMAGLGAQSQQLGLQGAQAKLAAGTMEQQTEQAGKDAMIKQFMQEMGFPYQQAQFLANIAMGTGSLSGSTTSTTQPLGIFGNLATGGRVGGYATGGGVSGPMDSGQEEIGAEGYVPGGVLPIGRLMTSEVPADRGTNTSDVMMQLAALAMGAKNGGVISARNGYANGGTPNLDALRRQLEIDQVIPSYGRRMRAENAENQQAAMDAPLNPASMGLGGNRFPQEVQPRPRATLGAEPVPGAFINSYGEVDTMSDPQGRPGDFSAQATAARPSGLSPLSNPVPGAFINSYGEVDTMSNPQGRPGDFAAQATAGRPSVIAPSSSPRPMPRPTGLAGADVAADTMTALGQAAPAITLGNAPAVGVSGVKPQVDTGVALPGGYDPIIPLGTQLGFITHELQNPEYNDYLRNQHNSPSEAAVDFDRIYERSGGQGNDRAAANAEDIYAAAQAGDMSNLPPNVTAAYNHFIQSGMDPIKAAGATGRLMVESYSRLDPNARNTIGGGNGTYGVAQWRGSRMEELAKFAGVPLEALTGAPVSTPEGRYYSATGTSGGLAGTSGTQEPRSGGLSGADMSRADKPYGERNKIGQFFYTPDGKLNKNSIMSVLGGLAAMAKSNTVSPISALLQGLGGGMESYKALEKQTADVAATNIDNVTRLNDLYNNFMFTNPEYSGMSINDFARAQGLERLLPKGGINYQDVAGTATSALSLADIRSNVAGPDGVSIPFMNDYASLNKLVSQWGAAKEGSPQRTAAEQAKVKLAEIEQRGYTTGIAQDGSAVNVPVESVRQRRGAIATDEANVETTQIFRDEAQKRLPNIGGDMDRVDRQIDIYSTVPSGGWTEEKARLGSIAATLGLEGIGGLPEGDQIAKIEEAIKEKASGIVSRGGTDGMTDYEREFISQSTASPNLQPEAIKKLLAIEKATLLREKDMLEGHADWMTNADNPYDLNAYKAEFASANPISEYIKKVEAGMPTFAGEAGAGPRVGEVKVFTGNDGKTYTGKWDGKGWVKQ